MATTVKAPTRAPRAFPPMEDYTPPRPCFGVCPTCGGTVLVRRYLMEDTRFVEEATPQNPLVPGAHGCPNTTGRISP
mgnify:CR=1 FL=1